MRSGRAFKGFLTAFCGCLNAFFETEVAVWGNALYFRGRLASPGSVICLRRKGFRTDVAQHYNLAGPIGTHILPSIYAVLSNIIYRIFQFFRFYRLALTRYRVHSPFVFELAETLLEDRRWYYAFDDIEELRRKMTESRVVLDVLDYGAAESGTPLLRQVPLRRLARVPASSPEQGRKLFRLVQWLKPGRILELGTSTGIGTLYLAAAASRQAKIISLEGSEACVQVARVNLGVLNLQQKAKILSGPFRETLAPALRELGQADLVFFDGHHREDATLAYFEQCLSCAHDQTVLVFDDIYWSPEMTAAWEKVCRHPRVTLSVDCFALGFVFLNPDFKSKQHVRLVPGRWKPWERFI